MIKETRTYTTPLTRALVHEMRSLDRIHLERPFKQKRADRLRQKLDLGLFYSPEWAIIHFQGKRYRGNGQHSSAMLSDCNGSFPQGMMVHMREFSCDTLQDVADLFMQFDSKDSARDLGDHLTAQGGANPLLREIPVTTLKIAARAIACALTKIEKLPRMDEQEVARLCSRHPDFVRWSRDFLYFDHLKKAPIGAAAFLTFTKDRSAADEFWKLVRDENHPDARHPSRVLAKFLNQQVAYSDKKFVYAKQITVLIRCLHAWNAFRAGEATDLKIYSEKLPKIK